MIHVGFPKTGTTFLQRKIFPRLVDARAYFDVDVTKSLLFEAMNYDDTIFDARVVKDRLADVWRDKPKVLLSCESLTGLEYRSGFVNRTLIAKRLKELGFTRLIVTIRNQFDVIESAYRQYVSSGGVLRFHEYVVFGPTERRYLYPEYFDYYSAYRLYADTFGPENVLVLQCERLLDPEVPAALFRFMQTEQLDLDLDGELVNPSLSYEKSVLLRLINHLTYNSYRPSHLISRRISTPLFMRALSALPFWNSRRLFVDSATRAAITVFYHESNARLSREAGITLAHTYP